MQQRWCADEALQSGHCSSVVEGILLRRHLESYEHPVGGRSNAGGGTPRSSADTRGGRGGLVRDSASAQESVWVSSLSYNA